MKGTLGGDLLSGGPETGTCPSLDLVKGFFQLGWPVEG